MAEINHTQAAQLTNQTLSSTTYTDISGASIDSSFFTAGKKYLILITAQVTINVGTDSTRVQALHGSTAFAQSELYFNPLVASDRIPYTWFTVWTAVGGEGIKLQQRCRDSAANTVSADQISIVAINLSDNVTENTDWFFNETDADATHDNTDKTGASITFTPSGASEWLVISHYQGTRTTGDGSGVTSRINRSGEASSAVPSTIYAATDTSAGAAPHQIMLSRMFALTAASNTFAEVSVAPASGGGVRRYSTIFAINLDKFKVHAGAWTEGTVALDATNYNVNAQTVNITPTVTGDVFAIAAYCYDLNNIANKGEFRLQVDDSDEPSGQTTDNYQFDAGTSNASGNIQYVITRIANMTAAAHTLDLDASVSATTSTPVAQHRTITAFTMELADSQPQSVLNVLSTGRRRRYWVSDVPPS